MLGPTHPQPMRTLPRMGRGITRAWNEAQAAAEQAGVRVHPLVDLEQGDRVRAVIDRVWGAQVLPRELLRAFQHAGGTMLGAEAQGELVGFVLGFLGWEEGLHVHSHMLAVMPEWQSEGVGYALKLAQRATCLDHGVAEVRWTYDPLVARNARFNLVKLGAVATRFLPAHYGEMSDRLNRGDRSDRLEVRWRLSSTRVEDGLRRSVRQPERGDDVLRAGREPCSPDPRPVAATVRPGAGAVVAIPRDHFELRQRDPSLGREWRDATARAFTACFAAGLEATWFTPQGEYLWEPAGAAR